jgi:hypothetical protein
VGALIGGHGAATHLAFTPFSVAYSLVMFPFRMVVPYLPLRRPPGDLLPDLSLHQALPIAGAAALVLAAVAVAGGIMLVRRARWIHGEQSRELLVLLPFLATAFYGLLIPAMNVGVVSLQDTQGERFLYFPSAFGVLLIALFLSLLLGPGRRLAVVSVVLALGSGVALFRSNENWRAAGGVARSVLLSLQEQEGADRLLIVNLPDHLNGAYIYRNRIAITEALQLFDDRPRFREIGVCSYQSLAEPEDATRIAGSGGRYAVQLSHTDAYFRIDDHVRERSSLRKLYTITDLTPRSYHLSLGALSRSDRALYYSAGRLIPLPR